MFFLQECFASVDGVEAAALRPTNVTLRPASVPNPNSQSGGWTKNTFIYYTYIPKSLSSFT